MSEHKRQVFKLDEEDISEILISYLTENHVAEDFQYQAISTIIGTPGEDLRYVAVLGDTDDEDFPNVDLAEEDSQSEFTKLDFGYEE